MTRTALSLFRQPASSKSPPYAFLTLLSSLLAVGRPSGHGSKLYFTISSCARFHQSRVTTVAPALDSASTTAWSFGLCLQTFFPFPCPSYLVTTIVVTKPRGSGVYPYPPSKCDALPTSQTPHQVLWLVRTRRLHHPLCPRLLRGLRLRQHPGGGARLQSCH